MGCCNQQQLLLVICEFHGNLYVLVIVYTSLYEDLYVQLDVEQFDIVFEKVNIAHAVKIYGKQSASKQLVCDQIYGMLESFSKVQCPKTKVLSFVSTKHISGDPQISNLFFLCHISHFKKMTFRP